MKHPKRLYRQWSCALIFLYSCLSMLFVPAPIHAVQLPKTAKLIPPDSSLLLDIDDFSQFRKQFEKTNLYRLSKDPAMAPFINNFRDKWQEGKNSWDNSLLGFFTELKVWPKGRVAVVDVPAEKPGDVNDIGILFITQWGEGIEQVKEASEKSIEKAIEHGARREDQDYRGVNVTKITGQLPKALSSIPPIANRTSISLHYCFVDDCLIGSFSPDVLKFVIAQIQGAGSATLADDDDYAATLRAIGAPAAGQICSYDNLKATIRTALAGHVDGNAKMFITGLGLTNVTSSASVIDLGGGPAGTSYGKGMLKVNGDKKGVFKMLDIATTSLRVPRFVPASAFSLLVINLDIKRAFGELSNILSTFSPAFAAMLYMPLLPPGSQGEPALQLKTDVIDHLGSQIILTLSPSPGVRGTSLTEDLSAPTVECLLAIAIQNRNALEKSISRLHSTLIAPNNPDARRQLLGHTIYTIDLSDYLPFFGRTTGAPDVAENPLWGLTVTDTHLILSSEAAVERAVRSMAIGGSTELIDSARWFAKAKSSIPSEVGLAALQDDAVLAKHIWSLVREWQVRDKRNDDSSRSQVDAIVNSGSSIRERPSSQAVSALFDFSLLPEFGAVRKYFGVSSFYVISRADGFLFELKCLNRDGTE